MSDSSAGNLDRSRSLSPIEHSSVMRWSPKDTGWMLNLFGTGIGAGVLYLPISAGVGGIWPLMVLAVFAGPMVWLAHRNLVRFCLSASDPDANITGTVREHFGETAGRLLILAYFLSIYPILLLYGIGITNVANSFVVNQVHMTSISRGWLSLLLLAALMAAMHAGEAWMLRAVKLLVYPLVIILCGISLYLVPQWSGSVFSQPVEFKGFFLALFITTPLLVFSFNHSPACSAFARSYRLQLSGSELCQKKTEQILKCNTLLLLVVILLFVFSCVLSLTPAELAQAREDNLPVLSVLASRSGNPVFAVVATAVAFLAIASSFFGMYLGALEGLQGLFTLYWLKRNKGVHLNNHAVKRGTVLFVLLTCWGAAYMDWSVIGMVEMLVVPVMASILYLMPVYALYRVERLKPCRNRVLDIFTALVGLVAISGFLVSKINGM